MHSSERSYGATHARSLALGSVLKQMITWPMSFAILITLGGVPAFSHADSGQASKDGRSLYTTYCMACHAPENVMVSSPKLGDKGEWSKRLRNGLDQTTDNAVKGFGAMPPKGGCMGCTREEIRKAIQYMANPDSSVKR